MKKIIIDKENQKERIDKFLKKELFLNGFSRGEIINLIKNGDVLLNNKKVKPSYALKENDCVSIKEIKKQTKLIPNGEINFEIVFQNENFIIINKPRGLVVHSVNFKENETLVNGLLQKFPEIESVGENPLRPGIVHRLDKDTSGLMIVAKNQKTFEAFKKKFKNREIEKSYVALVHGNIVPKGGVIEKEIARSSSYKKQVIAGKKTKTKIRSAVTKYRVLKSFSDFDLVEARPKTGRMHQVRIHFFSLGHPLVGDELYKFKKFENPKEKKGHLLHAQKIKFELFGKYFNFSSSLPNYFKKATI